MPPRSTHAPRLFMRSPARAFRALRDLWRWRASTESFSRAPADSPLDRSGEFPQSWRRGEDLRGPWSSLAAPPARSGHAPGCAITSAEILLRRLDFYALARREIDAVLAADPWLWEARCLSAEIGMALGERRASDPSSRGVPAASRPAFLAWRGAIKLWSGRPAAALADLDAAAALGNLDARGWRGGARLLLGRRGEAPS